MNSKGDDEEISKNFLKIILGAHDLSNENEIGRQIRKVQSYVIHETWDPSSMRFTGDLAKINLESDVEFTTFVRPICITNDKKLITNIDNGEVHGWSVDNDSGEFANVSRSVEIPIFDFQDCVIAEHLLARIIWRKSFCAGKKGAQVCTGSTGSGLALKVGNKHYLKGIVSSSINRKCSDIDKVIYTDVVEYYDFLKCKEIIKSLFK